MRARGFGRFLAFSLSALAVPGAGVAQSPGYEVWSGDQSNSVAGQVTAGVKGGYLYIFDSVDIAAQMGGGAPAQALDCGTVPGPCDLNAVFPPGLVEMDAGGSPTGMTLGDLSGFARLHAIEHDPQGRYVALSLHGLSGGFVGIMDAATKAPVALFRATGTNADGGFERRSVPTAHWNSDGSALIVANHDGKLLERIEVTRESAGTEGAVSLPQIGVETADETAGTTECFYRNGTPPGRGLGVDGSEGVGDEKGRGGNGRGHEKTAGAGCGDDAGDDDAGGNDGGGDEAGGTAGGAISGLVFNTSASLGMGKGLAVQSAATAFSGGGLVGTVAGSYDPAAMGDLTPAGECKENGCAAGTDATFGGRPYNRLDCPIISASDKAYVTFLGGGMLVVDTTATPMAIVGEYGNRFANGEGCGGTVVGNHVWFRAGVAGNGSGAYASTMAVYRLDDALVGGGVPNEPAIEEVYKDPSNTSTGGNLVGGLFNVTGQLPGTTTRQDAQGMAVTSGVSGTVPHVHVVNRLQNRVEVFNAETLEHSSYDLTSADGAGGGTGPCQAATVGDDPGLPQNDPTPDEIAAAPDGNLLVSLRGPAPVDTRHAAQGSCPGVGVIDLSDDGSAGVLAAVLRASNRGDSARVSVFGGYTYGGAERADMHGVAALPK